MHDATGWQHEVTVFLSYKRSDVDEVKMLQEQLVLRGVGAWRDMTHLPPGSSSKEEVTRIIAQECDVFLLYVTPASLVSDFIWNIEIPAALDSWGRDHNIAIVPVLRGVSTEQLSQACADHGQIDLSEFNAIALTGDTGDAAAAHDALSEVAQRILAPALERRLRAVTAESRAYEPALCLHTSPYIPPMDRLDLDLNWTAFFSQGRNERWPANEEWQEKLLPALYDVKHALSELRHRRVLHVAVHSPLPAAFALGFVLSRTARFTLALENEHRTWHSNEAITSESDPLVKRLFDKNDGDKQTAVVELEISRQVIPSMKTQLPDLRINYGHRLQLVIEGGPGPDAVKNSAHAAAIARQFSQELRNLYDVQGVRQVHLFFAAPAELAVLLGHYLNATGTPHVYRHDKGTGLYTLGCVLP